ncbi:hypothetical protein AVEN_144434-1 [Araneus ventricosus]|uniref:Uncharacterized protein n=1 Tax=Araneus ventricosus TaxID=182803 RepID=A0A4Y2E3M8_ARAVE|nr:hypothetical protein AVEN_144434-1 [Araneus ventricosus]
MYLSDGGCNCSSAEAGVLMAITSHGPTTPEGGANYHRQRASLSHYCTHQRNETPLTHPAGFHLCIRGALQWESGGHDI